MTKGFSFLIIDSECQTILSKNGRNQSNMTDYIRNRQTRYVGMCLASTTFELLIGSVVFGTNIISFSFFTKKRRIYEMHAIYY